MKKRKLNIKEVRCSKCGGIFYAKKQEADATCKECRKKYLQEWRRLPRVVKQKALNHRKLREEVIAGYGGKCACCGESTYEFLAIDHANGDGYKDRGVCSGWQIARRIIKNNFPPDYRILCHNCNLAIGFYGKCPHEKNRGYRISREPNKKEG